MTGRRPIGRSPVLKQSDDLSVVEERSHFTPDPTPVVTELPLQKVKKEPPSGPVLLKAKTQSGEKIEVYEEGDKLTLYMPKTGDQVQASEQEWYQIGYGALYELTPAEKGRWQRRLADACEIDMRGQVDAEHHKRCLVLRLDARVHQMVEEQRGYDDTRALPKQSSMFGDHAEAPVAEPLFGTMDERQQEDERVAAVVVPARAARKKAEEEARQAEEDARREAEHAEAESLEAERVEAERVAKEEAERKEREKQEMLERKAAEKAEAKRRKAEKKEENASRRNAKLKKRPRRNASSRRRPRLKGSNRSGSLRSGPRPRGLLLRKRSDSAEAERLEAERLEAERWRRNDWKPSDSPRKRPSSNGWKRRGLRRRGSKLSE